MNIFILRIVSIFYLILPNIIFSFGWFKWQLAVPVSVGFVLLLIREIQKLNLDGGFSIAFKDSIFLLILAFAWTLLCGIGGYAYETNDYWAHNARYNDLFHNKWPIYFAEKDKFACYYFGFFLVPALFSKVIHQLSIPALLFWATLGFGIGLHWIYVLLNKNKFMLIIFIFVGWFGHPVTVIISRLISADVYSFPFALDIWSLLLQSANVPNQVIPALICCAILLHDGFVRKTFEDSFFPITLCFIWTIFPSVVLVIIFGIVLLHGIIKEKFNPFHKSAFVKFFLPGLLFIPNFIYLLSSNSVPISGFVWKFTSLPNVIFHLSLSVWLTLLILYILTLLVRKFDDRYPLWFTNTLYVLTLVSTCFRMGIMNDWATRSTITFIIIITVIVLYGFSKMLETTIIKPWKLLTYKTLIVIFFLINHTQFLMNLLQNNYIVRKIRPDWGTSPKIPFDKYSSTYEAVKEHCSKVEADQYLGKKDSVYEMFLSK
jgi:hypothetical protein